MSAFLDYARALIVICLFGSSACTHIGAQDRDHADGRLSDVSTMAGETLFKVNVDAGDTDRRNCVVKTLVKFGGDGPIFVTLSDKDGNNYLGQVSQPDIGLAEKANGMNQLTFILPSLNKGQNLELVATEAGLNPARTFQWHDDQSTTAELRYGDIGVMTYMYQPLDEGSKELREQTYKVYHHVYSPRGDRLVTKGPGGLYPHHRGLFYGFNRISYDGRQADVWHCNNGESQTHEKTFSEIEGPMFGRHTVAINWNGRDGKPFAREIREMTAYKIGGNTLIEFDSILDTAGSTIKLDGDPQHAGFQFRASQEVPDHTKDKTFYIRPDGKGKPGEFRNWSANQNETEINKSHVNLPWNTLCFELPGKDDADFNKQPNSIYTCVYLDRPTNPKPARFSERDYGRFGSYFEYTLTPDKPLHANYRIWLQDGEVTVDQISDLSQDFVNPVRATTSD